MARNRKFAAGGVRSGKIARLAQLQTQISAIQTPETDEEEDVPEFVPEDEAELESEAADDPEEIDEDGEQEPDAEDEEEGPDAEPDEAAPTAEQGVLAGDDGQLFTDADEKREQAPIHPVEFPTRRDYTIAVQALAFRSAALAKLAKKASEEGYAREARIIMGDAYAIDRVILPRLREQQELQLVTRQELVAGVRNAIDHDVAHWMHMAELDAKKEGREGSEGSVAHKAQTLSAVLASRIANFAVHLAESAFSAGVAFRQGSPEFLAVDQLDSLRSTEM